MRGLAASVLVCVASWPAAAGQGLGPIPTVGDCDMATLMERLQSSSDLCCPPPSGACTCTIDCAVTFLPLMGSCRAILDAMLDSGDGQEDGIAAELDDLSTQCHEIPEEAVLEELRIMRDAGTCPESFLNNVAVANVTDSACTDSRDSCTSLVTAGVTCTEDIMVRGCQLTCGLCTGHRRAQLVSACPLSDFNTRADAVNTACCDDGLCQGVPNRCDAKCAIAYDPFFDDCSNLLSLQLPAPDVVKYHQLHTTCSTDLPIDDLIDALIQCREGNAAAQCPDLNEVAGMTITLSNGNIVSSTATYTCDASGGPPTTGDAIRTCQQDGRWSGTNPVTSGACASGPCRFTAPVQGYVEGSGDHKGGYQCVERGAYGNNEFDSWGVAQAGSVHVDRFDTEGGLDFLDISDSPNEDGSYSGSQLSGTTFEVTTGTTFSWTTDSSVPGSGFRLCCDK